jgi:hypothetical protein
MYALRPDTRDDPGAEPSEPLQDPARAGPAAAHAAVSLHSLGVSCNLTVGVKGNTGGHRYPVDGRRPDPGVLGRRRCGWRMEEASGHDGRKKANYQGLPLTFHTPFSGSSGAGRPGDRPRTSW